MSRNHPLVEQANTATVSRAINLPLSRGRGIVFAAVVLILISIVWLSFSAYQSHYVSGLRVLGDDSTKALIGQPKDGRGDEWSTYIPMLKQAYLEGFPERSTLEPYRERFDWFITLPSRGASLVLLPNQIAYFVMSGGAALSFQGLYYNLLLLLSVFWLFRNLRVSRGVAAAVGMVLLFSHLYQAWWTSNFPALGASILPFAVLTSSLRWRYRGPLLAWSIGHMLLGQFYPPFYFSLAVAVLPFVAACRPDLLAWRNLLFAALSVFAGCAAVAYFKIDYIEAVSGTTYPGLRISTGGGSSISTLLGVVFPTYPATSTIDVGASLYELSVVGSFFTLLAFAALPAVNWTRDVVRVTATSLIVLAVLAIYMLVGFPEGLARITGFFMVPGRRAQLGFSVLALFLSAFLVSNTRRPIGPVALLVVFGTYAATALLIGPRQDLTGAFFAIGSYPYIALAIVCISGAIGWLLLRERPVGATMLAGLLIAMPVGHVLIFGSFNPIMDASTILKPVDSQLTRDWKALHGMNAGQPFGVVGNYGHLLRGEGLEALEAIHLVNTDDEIYANAFPELNPAQRNRLFNQFRGIAFANRSAYDAQGLTAFFPARLHSVPFPHAVGPSSQAVEPLTGTIKVDDVIRKDLTRFVVYWQGGLNSPMPIETKLGLHLACKVDSSWLTRYPTGGPKLADEGISLRGLAGELIVVARSENDAAQCVEKMIVSDAGAAEIPFVVPERIDVSPSELRAGAEWSGKACALDIQQPMSVSQSSRILFVGYVIAPSNVPAGDFDIVLRAKDAYRLTARTEIARPDVAMYFGSPGLKNSGFRIGVKFQNVQPGTYSVDFHMTKDGLKTFCETGKSIVVE